MEVRVLIAKATFQQTALDEELSPAETHGNKRYFKYRSGKAEDKHRVALSQSSNSWEVSPGSEKTRGVRAERDCGEIMEGIYCKGFRGDCKGGREPQGGSEHSSMIHIKNSKHCKCQQSNNVA